MSKLPLRAAAMALLAGGAWLAWGLFRGLPSHQRTVATVQVRLGDIVVRSFARGELRATRSATLISPNLFGAVQVTKLAPLGAFAHAKDLIVEFDDSEVRSRLEEIQLELEQIDEQVKKAEADVAIAANQDDVDLLTARYGVRRAELEVKRNELLSAIDAKKNLLALDEARQRLKELESDVVSRRDQAKAQIAVLREKKNKGLIEMEREKGRLGETKLLAPISGLVAVKQNMPNFFFSGMQIPDIREGDQLSAGVPVADILDLSEMEVLARVGEIDRANLKEGQEAEVRLDAIAGEPLRATIKSMGGTATANVFSSDPAKKFDVVFALDMPQLFRVLGVKPDEIERILAVGRQNRAKPAVPDAKRPGGPAGDFDERELAEAKLPAPPEENSRFSVLLRPGLLADVQIVVERIPHAISIPNQAVFEKDGKTVVWVKRGRRFETRPVVPAKRSESIMVIAKGLRPGEEVALADPDSAPAIGKETKNKSGAMEAIPGAKGGN